MRVGLGGALALVALFSVVGPGPASALELFFERTFAAPGPTPFDGIEGLTFDQDAGDLIATYRDPDLRLFSTDGDFLGTITLDPDVVVPDGLHAIPGGNVLSTDGDEVEDFVRSTGAPGGLSFLSVVTDLEGITFDPTSGLIWGVSESLSRLASFQQDGTLVSEFSTAVLGFPGPQGIGFDPVTGALLVVEDDFDNLYLLSTAGVVLDQFDLTALSGISNVEGVTIDPATRTIYASGEIGDDATIAVFTLVPEPSTALLVMAGLLALGRRRA